MTWKDDVKKSKFRRTKQWRSQPDFDREILQIIGIPELRHLSRRYHIEIQVFARNHDLTVNDNFTIIQSMKQKYKMINEEIDKRGADIKASPTYYGSGNTSFFTEQGIVWDHQKEKVDCTIEFNFDETRMIMRDGEGIIVEDGNLRCNNVKERPAKEKTRKEVYENWKY